MRFTKMLSAIAMVSLLGACIEKQAEVATITLDYLTSAQAEALAQPYLSSEGRLFRSEAALNTITVRDRRENVRRVERLINQRDASPQNVSLHFQVVRATPAGGIDPALAKVGGALRELLRFEGYELVAQTVVSASERRVVEQSINAGAMPLQLGVRINDVVGGSGSVDMEVDLRRVGHSSLLTTNVVVPMGQTVVLGSAYPGVEGEALILTVRGERGSTRLRTSSRRSDRDAHVEAAEHVDAAEHAEHAEAAAEARAAHAGGVAVGQGVPLRTNEARTKSAVTGTKTGVGTKAVPGRDTRLVPPPPHATSPSASRARQKASGVPPGGLR